MIRLTIKELQERWTILYYEMGVNELLITEDFPKYKKRTFTVCGLSMELIEDYVLCSDNDDVIIDNVCSLRMFLRHHLTSIVLIPKENSNDYIEKLEFNNLGTVYIEKIC